MDNLGLFYSVFGTSGKNTSLDILMIFGAEYVIYLTFVSIFILALKGKQKERKAFLLTLLSIPIAVILVKIIHIFILEPRPFVANDIDPLISHKADTSFPSRHTTLMATVVFAYTFYKSKWSTLFLTLMLWVGLSRVYVGVHYPLDIVGGIIVGASSLLIAWQIKKFLGKKLLAT